MRLEVNINFAVFFCDCFSREANRPPLPEPHTSEAEEAEDVVLQSSDRGTGEAVSPPEVPGLRRTLISGQAAQDDGRPGQDLVPEQTDQVEVCTIFLSVSVYFLFLHFCLSTSLYLPLLVCVCFYHSLCLYLSVSRSIFLSLSLSHTSLPPPRLRAQ